MQIALWLLAFVLAVCVYGFNLNYNKFIEINEIVDSADTTEPVDYELISSQQDLETLATNVKNGTTYAAHYFKMTTNITLDSAWEGIGTYESSSSSNNKSFNGHFDGNGYTITYDNAKYCLFNYVGEGATIKNIHTAGNLDYSNLSAAIVSCAVGTSTNLVTIEKCKSEVIRNDSSFAGVSGVVFNAEYATISECANLSDLADYGVGSPGMVGGVIYSATNTTIQDCYNAGDLDCSASGPGYTNAGGIINYAGDNVSITRCYNSGTITGSKGRGLGVSLDAIAVSKASSATITDCYYLSGGSSSYGTAKTASELKAGNFANWDFQTIWYADGTNYPTLRALEESSVPTFVFTIVYNNGTSATTKYSLTEGATQILPTLSYEGYKFNGWLITNDAGTNKSSVSKSGDDYILTAGDGEATITAQWSQIVFSLTLNCASLAGENYMAYIYRGNYIIMQVSLTKGQTTIKLPYVSDYANNKYSICFVFAYCGNIKFTSLTNAEISAKSERNIVISKFDSTTETASIKYEIANPRVNTTVII